MAKKKDEKSLEEKKKEKEVDEEEINKLLDDIVNGEKSEESLEEFVEGISKQIKRKKNNNTIAYIFGLLVHKNIFIHFAITLVLNFLLMFALQGFFKLVVYDEFYMFVISILLFSVVEVLVKWLFIRFLLKLVMQTFGLIFVVLQIIYIELMYYFLPGYSFDEQPQLIIFILMFILFRYIIVRVAHSYIGNLKNKKRGEQ
ncbi:MAG: phage holin family protein [Acholeplasmatales bacterium]|nr:phage holin family protein [Acholeplasmatales bacterium]